MASSEVVEVGVMRNFVSQIFVFEIYFIEGPIRSPQLTGCESFLLSLLNKPFLLLSYFCHLPVALLVSSFIKDFHFLSTHLPSLLLPTPNLPKISKQTGPLLFPFLYPQWSLALLHLNSPAIS